MRGSGGSPTGRPSCTATRQAVTYVRVISELNWFTDSPKTGSHLPDPARSLRSAHMGKLDGKVAVVTGAARGQGRSHAVTLAQAGADIIALDICADIENVKYPLATPADLAETQQLVEKLDRRAVTYQADVREPSQVRAAVDSGVSELGRLDIVVANAGIAPLGPGLPGSAFLDAVNVNFAGVVNLVTAAYPHLEAGALEDFEPASAAMFPLPISWLEPRDISAAVVFLASDDARYITGQQLRVDGGVALKHTSALPNP